MSISLADAVFWIAVACCAVAHLAILRSVIVSPARAPGQNTTPLRRVMEIAWAVLPAIALAFVLLATWHAMHPAPASTGMGVAAVASSHLP